MCHLTSEKALKASVQEITGKTPPKTHNPRYLLKLSQLEPPGDNFVRKLILGRSHRPLLSNRKRVGDKERIMPVLS